MTETAPLAQEDQSDGAARAECEDLPRAGNPDAPPLLTVGDFQAPLDWLLEMARARKIDIANLPVAALVDGFVDAMDAALAERSRRGRHLAQWGEWLVMAATLIWLRSRLLLPADAGEAGRAEAEGLRRRLLDRAQTCATADWLERCPQLGRDRFPRGRVERPAAGRIGDITDLLRACLVALRVPAVQVPASRSARSPLWRVTDAIGRIRELLPKLQQGSPLSAFLPAPGTDEAERDLRRRAAVASTLVASLELARSGTLELQQLTPCGAILVTHCGSVVPSGRRLLSPSTAPR